MSAEIPELDPAAFASLLPVDVVGAVTAVRPIALGQSGAGVYAVSAARGELILRVSGDAFAPQWDQQLALLRRAVERGIAPPIVHVDEQARAIVSVRIGGVPLPAALADPSQRPAVLASVVEQLRAVHALDPAGVGERDPIVLAREQLARQRTRAGFPAWAEGAGAIVDEIAATVARDPRRVVNHNDVNPGNILWDGTRAWLVDWDVAGLGHPSYDLAALAMFLQLPDDAARGLLALQERRPLGPDDHTVFAALRRLTALLCGLVFLAMVPDLALLPAAPPTLTDCYAALRAGTLDLRDPRGRAAFALALLSTGIGATTPS